MAICGWVKKRILQDRSLSSHSSNRPEHENEKFSSRRINGIDEFSTKLINLEAIQMKLNLELNKCKEEIQNLKQQRITVN